MVPLTQRAYTNVTNTITYAALVLASFAIAMPIINNYSKITVFPPIVNNEGTTVTWIDDDTMMLQTRGGKTTTNCPEIWVERGLETTKGRVSVTLELLSGGYKALGMQPGKTILKDVKKGFRPPSVGLLHRPEGVRKEDILGYVADQIVTQDNACENEWWGRAKLTKVTVDNPTPP